MTDHDEVLRLERAGWTALATSGDDAHAFYREHLADEVAFLLPGGMVLDDRAKALDSMSGRPWDSFELADERVVPLSEEAVAVTYRARAHRGETDYQALVTSTWVRTGEGWRLSVHQQTPL